jgi:L-2-hydroxyglutarate oxidase LhgO
MEHQVEIRQMFDESFKRMVIEEYLATKCNKMDLLRKYNIRFKSAIQAWMKKLGYEDIHRIQRIKFDRSLPLTLSMATKSENIHELQKRVHELEQQLLDEKLRVEAYSRMIDKAEKELKISIKKKPNTK